MNYLKIFKSDLTGELEHDYELRNKRYHEKWTMPIRDWGMIHNQFLIIFDERLSKY